MRLFVRLLSLLTLLCVPAVLCAQTPVPETRITSGTTTYDLSTLDGLVQATYGLISGPVGQRDTAAIRKLFLPTARLIYLRRQVSETDPTLGNITLDSYLQIVARNSQREAFYERELGRRTETFGRIAQVWSSYAISKAAGGEPDQRGINALQLVFESGRWWVAGIVWDTEGPGRPLPGN
jgi:hypothetical protein